MDESSLLHVTDEQRSFVYRILFYNSLCENHEVQMYIFLESITSIKAIVSAEWALIWKANQTTPFGRNFF